MTPDQVQLVQQSFSKVAPISEQAAVLFYGRLFEIAPQVKSMFPVDTLGTHYVINAPAVTSLPNGKVEIEPDAPADADVAIWSARRNADLLERALERDVAVAPRR